MVLWILPRLLQFRLLDFHRLWCTFPGNFGYRLRITYAVRNPNGIATTGLASSHFARRYFENRCFFLFLRLLRCFSSAGFPPHGYVFTVRRLGIA